MSRGYAHWKKSRLKRTAMRNRQRKRNYDRGRAHLTLAERAARRAWTEADDARVLAHTIPDRQLAVEIRRSTQAIIMRRCKLKARA